MIDDHPRISTREVCALARYTSATLWRRIDAGHMPAPIDRGGRGFIFDRAAVLKALGIGPAFGPSEPDRPDGSFDPNAFREALARRVRRDKGACWRDRLSVPAQPAAPTPQPTPEVIEPARITSRELCVLGRFTKATLRRRIDAGHMPPPVDRGTEGYLFDREAAIRALGMEGIAAGERMTTKLNTMDGQHMSDFVRARRQRAFDNLPPPMSKEDQDAYVLAFIAAHKAKVAAKRGG